MKYYKAFSTALLIACTIATSQAYALVLNFAESDIGYVGTMVDGSFNGPYDPNENAEAGIFAGKFDPSAYFDSNYAYDSQAIFEFSLSNNPNYHAIKSATLSFDIIDIEQTNYFGSCFNFVGCPVPEQLDLYGFSGDGVVTTEDYNAGSFLATMDSATLINTTINFDVTDLTKTLLSSESDFIGFNFRTNSYGGIWFPEAALIVDYSVSEPSSLALLALVLVGIWVQWRKIKAQP